MIARISWPAQIALIVSALALSACGGSMSDLEDYATDVKSRKSGEVDPIPQIVPYSAFTYVAASRRDPFAALTFARADSGTGPKPDLNRNREPLEEYPLDGLRMVGTIQRKNDRYALVRAADGVIHRVTAGNYMGQNFGKIIAINDADIQLVELIPDGFGGYTEQPANVALSTD